MSWHEARPQPVHQRRIRGNPGPVTVACSRALNPQTLLLGRFRIATALRRGTNFRWPKNAAALVWPTALFELLLLRPFLVARVSRCIRPGPWQCPNPTRAEPRRLFLE